MLIAHSSAASTRYKLDVLRALTLPVGAHLTFRYGKRLLPDKLGEEFEKDSIKKERVLISSLHDDSANQTVAYIPIRFAEIVATKVLGTMCLLVMRLGGFALVDDNTTWTEEIQKLASDLPSYRSGRLGGMFCERLSNGCEKLCEVPGMNGWECAVKRLQAIPTYASEPYFYFIPGIRNSNNRKYVKIEDGRFRLKTSSDYRLHLIYYAVSKLSKDYLMKMECNDGILKFVDSDMIFVDTRYDEKLIRLRAMRSDETRNVSLRIKRLEPGSTNNAYVAPSVDLEFRIQFRWLRASFLTVAMAISMFVGIWLSATEGTYKGSAQLEALLGMGASALLTSLFAVFGIRKYF